MEDAKIVKKLNKLQRIQADIGRRIDRSISRDDYSELLHLETMYRKLALQIARIRQTMNLNKSRKQIRGY